MATHICDLQKHKLLISYPGDSAGLEAIYSDSSRDVDSKTIQEDTGKRKGMKLQRAKVIISDRQRQFWWVLFSLYGG